MGVIYALLKQPNSEAITNLTILAQFVKHNFLHHTPSHPKTPKIPALLSTHHF
jgi:hypothetical protein